MDYRQKLKELATAVANYDDCDTASQSRRAHAKMLGLAKEVLIHKERKRLFANHRKVFDHCLEEHYSKGWELSGPPYFETDPVTRRETWYQDLVREI